MPVPSHVKQHKLEPLLGFIPYHHVLSASTVLLLACGYRWPLRWIISGAPTLSFVILQGAFYGYRVLPGLPLWTLILVINFSYSIAATSWLLYWVYLATCYPGIFLTCLFQFDAAATFARKRLRHVLRQLEFINDKIAFFNLPALEIDVDVEGLMVIRGITFSLSSLTLTAHGIEVGIKFSDDMELALAVDDVTVSFFRRIDIGDVYGNVKGGQFEMTFGKLAPKSRTVEGKSVMVTDTPLLVAAAANGDTSRPPALRMLTMTQKMTDGAAPKDSSVGQGFENVKQLSPDDEKASNKYREAIKYINETSAINVSREELEQALRENPNREDDIENDKDKRAAICTQLHDKPTIPHPPKRSIKVSTIKALTPPRIRRFLHRLPLLLRLLLNPIAYFHPVFISSITAGGSGRWLQNMLSELVFKDFAEQDSEIRKLKARVSSWLSDANFVFEVVDIIGMATVPINTIYDITSHLTFEDVMAYRTLPKEVDLKQIIRLGGADARISLPSYLLPHHEHLLPSPPTAEDEQEQKQKVEEADGKPQAVLAERDLEQTRKDETNMNISTHVRLPACFDQELLNFIAALVKATKLVEMESSTSEPSSTTVEIINTEVEKHKRSLKEIAKAVKTDVNDSMRRVAVNTKDSMRRVAVDAVANDRWIAKLVGKVTKQLETAQGDLGYSGDVPIPLKVYRDNARVAEEEGVKLMP